MVNILFKILDFGDNIILNKTYVTTPKIIFIVIYYFIFFSFIFLRVIYAPKNKNKAFFIRIRNLISHGKYNVRKNKNIIFIIILILILFIFIINIIPKDLKIYFIDVGQGDSCLIVTPRNKTILIDGGGSENYDVGKNTLIPYLLDRGIKKLDYILISHFDTDHIGGILEVMEELKVNTVIISKQGEDSENYKKFIEIVNKKKIKVLVVKKKNRLKIENDIYFDILWPNSENLVYENILNNNSIVCKLEFKNFSCIFTGDIEKQAEQLILKEYENNLSVLNSTILKVAHHGSKTSSIEEFLKVINPKIALIGVGENNKFGHPNEEVINRLENMRM